jgi:hypothetical protein
MNAELEALSKALQAIAEARDEQDFERLNAIYESRLDDASERLAVTKGFLKEAVRRRHIRWLKAQRRPSSMPPKA